jgi:hypothetical protein
MMPRSELSVGIWLIIFLAIGIYGLEQVKEVGMRARHKKEWPALIKVAREYNLSAEDTMLLLAIRDAENGPVGYEFGVKAAKGTNLEEQAKWTAGSIRANRTRYQEYLTEETGYRGTVAGEDPMDFPEFMAYYGSPTGYGWAPIRGEIPEDEKKLNWNWAPNVRELQTKYTRLFKEKGVALEGGQ